MHTPYSVFLSCGTPYSAEQEVFISAVRTYLRGRGCEPKTVGQDSFSVRQPAELARHIISECDGAVVIAFERTRIIRAIDKPGSSEQKEMRNESHPTVWNQMEAAMAYGQGVPILTFVQSGLKRQAMLSDRMEWAAIEADLAPALLQSDQFNQVFLDWFKRMTDRKDNEAKNADIDIEKIEILPLLSRLNIKQVFYILGLLFIVMSTLCTTSFKIGQSYSTPSK